MVVDVDWSDVFCVITDRRIPLGYGLIDGRLIRVLPESDADPKQALGEHEHDEDRNP